MPTHLIGNDTFQEVDFVGITGSICKYAVMVRKREDLAETIKRAFYIAKTGKSGVVVVDLPKDVQRAYGSDFYSKEIIVRGYKPKLSVHRGQLSFSTKKGFNLSPIERRGGFTCKIAKYMIDVHISILQNKCIAC